MLSSSISRVTNNIKAGKKRNVIKMDESPGLLAEEATTRSGEDALLAVDDDVASTGSFQILMAFHVPAADDEWNKRK